MIPASDPLYYNPGSSSFSDCEGSENWSSRSAPRQSCGTHQNKMSWKLYWAMECCMCVWMCVCVSASGSFVENVTTWRPVEGHYRIVRGLVQCSWSSDEGSEEEAGGMSIGTGHLWDSHWQWYIFWWDRWAWWGRGVRSVTALGSEPSLRCRLWR